MTAGPEILAALMTPAGQADPYPLYAQAHQAGPVSAIGDGWFLACGYAAISTVLRDPGFGLPDAPAPRADGSELSLLSRSILRANPPDHPRMRSLMSQVFTARRVAALRPAIENAVDALLSQLAEAGDGGQPADFMTEFAFRLPVTVICELLGVPAADQDRFRPLAADLTEAAPARTPASATPWPASKQASPSPASSTASRPWLRPRASRPSAAVASSSAATNPFPSPLPRRRGSRAPSPARPRPWWIPCRAS